MTQTLQPRSEGSAPPADDSMGREPQRRCPRGAVSDLARPDESGDHPDASSDDVAADEVAEFHAGGQVRGLNVFKAAPGRGVEGGDADAGAVELGDDVGRRAAVDGYAGRCFPAGEAEPPESDQAEELHEDELALPLPLPLLALLCQLPPCQLIFSGEVESDASNHTGRPERGCSKELQTPK